MKFEFKLPKWDIEEMTGYEPITTFWQDFSIAEAFGIAEVKDTYRRAFNEWHEDVEFVTELVLVLNHKIWYHYDAGREALALVYDELWRECDGWCCENLQGADAEYYFDVTD